MARPEIIYSSQKRGFVKGYRYANPRAFAGPRQGVTSVVIVGSWPEVEAAYRMANPTVRVTCVRGEAELQQMLSRRSDVGEAPAARTETPPSKPAEPKVPAEPKAAATEVSLPSADEIAGMAWPALRGIATQVSGKPVNSRDDARTAIEAERERRFKRLQS